MAQLLTKSRVAEIYMIHPRTVDAWEKQGLIPRRPLDSTATNAGGTMSENTAKPVRLQRSRRPGAKLVSPNGLPVVCVTRPGKWGNPHAPGRVGPLGRSPNDSIGAVGLFLAMLGDEQHRAAAGYPSPADIRRDLRDKNLACYCDLCPKHVNGLPLDVVCTDCDPCHADVLLITANTPEAR